MENEIKDAEPEIPAEEISEEARKKNFRTKLALLLVLGFLVGIVVKTEAAKRIVIGFEDYKVKNSGNRYDLNQIQKELAEKTKIEQEEAENETADENVPAEKTNE